MKGFIIDHLDVDVSDERSEKIDVSNHGDGSKIIDGNKFKTATAIINFTSTGDVSSVESEDLLKELNNILPLIIKLDKEDDRTDNS